MERIITRVELPYMAMPKFKRVAAYARVSSGKDEMLHSLAAQVSYYSNLIQQNPEWVYIGVYADEAFTGTKDDRPEFLRLIADCKDGKIDMIVTKSISRFARNTVTLLQTVRVLKLLGVDVFFEEQNIHTISDEGELLLSILASHAQEESLSVSENCKWRIRMQFKQGELACLRFMYGYRIKKGHLEIDEVQADVVRQIFSDYLGGLGGEKIAKKLNSANVVPSRFGKWTRESVMAILKNEKFTGNSVLQKRLVTDHLSKKQVINNGDLPKYIADHTHPALVDSETFEQTQAVIAQRRMVHGAKGSTRNRYPFSGAIYCENCGKNYKRKISRGKPTWQCSTFLQIGKSACSAKAIPESILLSTCSEVLGLDVFDDIAFKREIAQIRVPEFNKLVLVLRNGKTSVRAWQHQSRRDSWTDEMRKVAREHAIRSR